MQILTNIDGKELSDPVAAPFWKKAEELGLLVVIHPNGFTHGERLKRFYFNNVIGNPLETTIALHYLIFDGVLERHPKLKLLAVHGGGYLGGYYGRIDHVWGARSDAHGDLPKPPTSYLKQIYVDTVVFSEGQLKALVETFGADHVVMGTDYPFDMADYDPVGHVASIAAFDSATVGKIVGGNTKRILGLCTDCAAPQIWSGMSWIDNSPLTIWGVEPYGGRRGGPGPVPRSHEPARRRGSHHHHQRQPGKAGFTATAVASVSDSPPTVLVCLNRKSQITPIMRENKVFCVNTLASSDEELAECLRRAAPGHFMADRFKFGDWTTLETGAPALTNAIAALDCRVLEMKSVATHDIYFGEVAAIRLANAEKALVYHARAYKHV